MIIENIKKELLLLNEKYIKEADDGYDFWNNHIKYVVIEAVKLANTYNADLEIVELAALLHDIALVAKVGTKTDHHLNSSIIAKDLLTKYDYPQNRMEKVLGCIINHRSSKNATNIEELCLADADIISHFYNIPNSFMLGIKKFNFTKPEQFIQWFKKDYDDLSEQTKLNFKSRFNNIMQVLFCDLWQDI